MTSEMTAYIQELQRIPGQQVLLTRMLTGYPETDECPVAVPSDQLWMHWWTHMIGATPTMLLAHLHHVGANRTRRVGLQEIADWFTPIDEPGGYSLEHLHWDLARLGQHRLVGAAPLQINGPPEVLILASPIPRPGPIGFKAIGQAVEQLTNGSGQMVKGLGDVRDQ